MPPIVCRATGVMHGLTAIHRVGLIKPRSSAFGGHTKRTLSGWHGLDSKLCGDGGVCLLCGIDWSVSKDCVALWSVSHACGSRHKKRDEQPAG